MIGIYAITNTVNGRVYVGQSVDIKKRLYHHFYDLRKGTHNNIHLQRAFNEYGETAFEIKVLEECSKEELNTNETKWYLKYKNNSYNLGATGEVETMSDEMRNRHKEMTSKWLKEHPDVLIKFQQAGSKSLKGRVPSEEQRKAHSEKMKKYYDEHPEFREKNLIQIKNIKHRSGFKHTEEEKRKHSESLKKYYQTHSHPFSGKHHSEETKAKMRASLIQAHARRKAMAMYAQD